MDITGIDSFIQEVRDRCNDLNIKLVFKNTKSIEVEKGIRCSGYFDHYNDLLIIAKGSPLWLGNLVHESCHLDQWCEQSEIWKKESKNGTTTLDKWLLGKKVESLTKSINNLILLELDCEKRAIEKIVKHDLPINTVTYIQRANEVLMYYRFVHKTGRWSNKTLNTYHKFPSKFMSLNWYKRLSPKAEKIFLQSGF